MYNKNVTAVISNPKILHQNQLLGPLLRNMAQLTTTHWATARVLYGRGTLGGAIAMRPFAKIL